MNKVRFYSENNLVAEVDEADFVGHLEPGDGAQIRLATNVDLSDQMKIRHRFFDVIVGRNKYIQLWAARITLRDGVTFIQGYLTPKYIQGAPLSDVDIRRLGL